MSQEYCTNRSVVQSSVLIQVYKYYDMKIIRFWCRPIDPIRIPHAPHNHLGNSFSTTSPCHNNKSRFCFCFLFWCLFWCLFWGWSWVSFFYSIGPMDFFKESFRTSEDPLFSLIDSLPSPPDVFRSLNPPLGCTRSMSSSLRKTTTKLILHKRPYFLQVYLLQVQ